MAGALASLLGLHRSRTASQAGLVTVNLSNNYISAAGGNHLNVGSRGRRSDLAPLSARLPIATPFNGFANRLQRRNGLPALCELSIRQGRIGTDSVAEKGGLHISSGDL